MLTLITPTSDRPLAFGLCERWMARQDFTGSIQWLVVDDGREPAKPTQGQEYVRREPSETPLASFLGNLAAGLERARGSHVLIVEDDDWYAPNYLSFMAGLLGRFDLGGEGRARYYNLASRRWKIHANRSHASLCQTGMSRECAAWLLGQLPYLTSAFVDMHLWRHAPEGMRRVLAPWTAHSCGIKGLPGKGGLGMGHRMDDRYPLDESGLQLQAWIGPDDARVYERLMEDWRYGRLGA